MTITTPMMETNKLNLLKRGTAIPASPLALNENRKLDEKYQRAVYRYYHAAQAGGIAVGVHTTQFEIRDPKIGLFEPVLTIAAETIDELVAETNRPMIKVGGICGKTDQAIKEAELLSYLGYDVALLSVAALKNVKEKEIITHCKEVSKVIPLIGFYLQDSVGGMRLSYSFWREFAEIENVVAIKMAPFDRYKTIDVVRAVAMSSREKDITLYTGNDDNIIMDLLTPFTFNTPNGKKTIRVKGGLLGQWAVWTKTAVEILDEIHAVIDSGNNVPFELIQKSAALTDANAVVFDAANNFDGCIPGINEVLKRQGLLSHSHCLDKKLSLSPGQTEELDRINLDYPWLIDDSFIKDNLDNWFI